MNDMRNALDMQVTKLMYNIACIQGKLSMQGGKSRDHFISFANDEFINKDDKDDIS